MSSCRAFGLALAIAVLGCRSSGIKVPPDAGAADVAPAGEDAMSLADSGSDVSPDLRPASDSIAVVDSTRGPSPALSDALDLKLPTAEVSSDSPFETAPDGLRIPRADSGSGTPAIPRDVTVYTARDFSDADPQCVAATPGWLTLLATLLAEAQQCSADSDCAYASFSDGCGVICALAMNWQRMGDLGTPIYSYASSNCTTCPKLPSYPSCPPPTTMFCNAGRCEYMR